MLLLDLKDRHSFLLQKGILWCYSSSCGSGFSVPNGCPCRKSKRTWILLKLVLLWELHSQQMLYSEREHPLKTIWCLLINNNSVFRVLSQEKRRKTHVGLASWVKTGRFHPHALLRSRFHTALVCQHFALSSSDIWQDQYAYVEIELPKTQAASCSPALRCGPIDT